MRTVEVKSNIAGDIMNIRRGVVYKDPAAVIDELFQNCQRAKANNVQVTVANDTVMVQDNGIGCKDPQALFEKNMSAWGNENEAFGEGFFSVFLLADIVKARSYDWELTLDVLHMLETHDTSVEVTTGLPIVGGLSIELRGQRIKEEASMLQLEIRKLARVMPFVASMNGYALEHEELIQKKHKNDYIVRNEKLEAVLRPHASYGFVEYYYENRPVRSDYMAYVTGHVHICKGMVTLKAPDRKEFIYDTKREVFLEYLDEAIRQMYLNFIKNATDEELDAHEDGIVKYVNVEEYASILSVDRMVLDGKDHSEEGSAQDTAVPKWEAADIEVMKNIVGMLEKELDTGEVTLGGNRTHGELKKYIDSKKMLVFVPVKQVESLVKEIKRAEYNGFKILYAKNRLYENAFRFYGVTHIENMDDVVEGVITVKNAHARNKKEERFLALMSRVSEYFELPADCIQLANLQKEYRLIENDKLLSEECDVHGLCKPYEGKIYIDRSIVGFPKYRAQVPEYPTVTVHDYKVLLCVIQVLSHELAHMLYGFDDNTVEHASAMVRIGYEVANLF